MKYLKTFEQYDSEELRGKIGDTFNKDALKDLVKLEPYKNKFNYGSYHGKDSGYLNDLIYNAMHGKIDTTGMIEEIYKLLLKEIPEFRTYKIEKEHFEDNNFFLNLKKEIPIKKSKLDDEYSIKINLWIKYHTKNDDIFSYEEDKILVLFVPDITVTRTSYPLYKNDKNNDLGEIESDNGMDNFINKLQKKLYGKPDKEDMEFIKKFEINKDNLTLGNFLKLLPTIKNNLKDFSHYVNYKYDILI